MQITAFLIHGMGRTPLSMCRLARRLRAADLGAARVLTHCFGYSATFEQFASCRTRLLNCIEAQRGDAPYVLIGHSLGTVLLRSVLPELPKLHMPLPAACFLLAPPTEACLLARKLAPYWPYRVFNGEMGQRLADPTFMASLPIPTMPTKMYVGTSGPTGRFSPFGAEANDGILKVSETVLPGVAAQQVPAWHSFIMNHEEVVVDILKTLAQLFRGNYVAPEK